MSKKVSKTFIGAFVVGAIALAVIGVIIFGSGKFLSTRQHYVMYFDGSVKGLQVGAPVIFRGVKIGEVSDIVLRADLKTLTMVIPVYIDVDPEKFQLDADQKPLKRMPEERYQGLLKKGLRARLEMQSFVTGQLMIGLDLYPDTPIKLVGLDKKYQEIPTIPTTMEELTKTLQNLPIKEIFAKLDHTLEGIDKVVNSPAVNQSMTSLNQMLKDTDKLAKNIDAHMGPLAASLERTSDAAHGTFVQAEKTLAFQEGVPGEIASGIKDTLKAARLTLEDTQQIAAQNANLGYELSRTLEQMTAMSRSFRSLADYLDRHPESLIRGKNPSKGE
ncbi:MAG: MlaD family protein [Dissulfurispiraceae bacterium]